MDWSSLAPLVAGVAPKLAGLLGTAVGGPLGGVVGSLAGTAIAGVLGVAPTPDAVAGRLASDPKAQAKIEKLEAEHADALIAQAQVQIAALTQEGETARENISEVNATIRAQDQLGDVKWWHWRHLIGYLVLAFGIVILAIMVRVSFFGGANINDFVNLFNATSIFVLGLFGLLGYVAQDTTRQKIAAATSAPPATMSDQLLGTVKSLAAKVTRR